MAVNALTATGKTVGSPALGQPLLKRIVNLVAVGKAVGSPALGQPLVRFAHSLLATSLAVAQPLIGESFFSIVDSARTLITLPNATSIVALPPLIGRPLTTRFDNSVTIAAVNKTVSSLVFGQPGATQILGILPLTLPTSQIAVSSPVIGSPHFSQYFPLFGGDMRGLPAEPKEATPYYRTVNAIWPDLLNRRAVISPSRNGVDRKTGRMLQGWDHVEQSMEVIFATPFHERILRRWVGSYVPYILGETYAVRIVTRFFWAIAVSIDLWEPNFRIKQVFYMGDALDNNWTRERLDAVGEYRLGHGIFRTEGIYRPRAHLGDPSPYQPRAVALIGLGTEIWDPAIAP